MIRVATKLILIFILAYAGVKVWYNRLEDSWLAVPSPAVASVQQQAEVPTEVLRKTFDYNIIVERNIFQAVLKDAEKEKEVVVEEVLAPTQLKLALMGTVSGNSDRNSRAIISDEQKKQQDIYQVGDTIQGAFIKSIERGKVILQVNGRDEVLELQERKGGGPAYTPAASDFYQEPTEQKVRSSSARRKPVVRPKPQIREKKERGAKKRDKDEGIDSLPLSEQEDLEPEDEYQDEYVENE